MKHLIIYFIISIISFHSYGQVDKYSIKEFQLIEKDNNSHYLYSSDWNACNKWSAVVNIPKKRISIYLDSTAMEFNIVKMDKSYKDRRSNLVFLIQCVDDHNTPCYASFITAADGKSSRTNTLNIEYNDCVYVFSYEDQ